MRPLSGPFAWLLNRLLRPEEVVGWLWLAGVLLFIDLRYRLLDRPSGDSFGSNAFLRKIYRHRSAILEYQFFLAQQMIALAGARLLLFDIGHTVSQYFQHKTAFFWEFHTSHHATEVLTPITQFVPTPSNT